MRASGASEIRQFLHFLILKLLFPSIFCWYSDRLGYFVSETYLFSGLKYYICIHNTSNAFSFYYLCMVWCYFYKRQYTDKTLLTNIEKMYVYMRA